MNQKNWVDKNTEEHVEDMVNMGELEGQKSRSWIGELFYHFKLAYIYIRELRLAPNLSATVETPVAEYRRSPKNWYARYGFKMFVEKFSFNDIRDLAVQAEAEGSLDKYHEVADKYQLLMTEVLQDCQRMSKEARDKE